MQTLNAVEIDQPSEVGEPPVHGASETRLERRLDAAGEAGPGEHGRQLVVERPVRPRRLHAHGANHYKNRADDRD